MTVLAAWNATPASDRALTVALELAQRDQTRVHLVHCFEHELGDSPTSARRDAAQVTKVQATLEDLAATLQGDGVEISVEVVHGSAGSVADQLLAVADSIGATMIVVGSEPRSVLSKVVLGSATNDVVARARCPVVTVGAL